MVFQDVYLFQDTIAGNIGFGKSGVSQQKIEQAARLACCYDFIMKLPEGYNTMVGEGGSTLSMPVYGIGSSNSAAGEYPHSRMRCMIQMAIGLS